MTRREKISTLDWTKLIENYEEVRALAQLSLLSQYAAVTRITEKLLVALRGMGTNNSKSVLSFLVSSLPRAELGKHYPEERIIRFTELLWWDIGGRGGFRCEIPIHSVDSAIAALNARLEKKGLPYRVGRRCQCGDPRSRKFRRAAPYVIGLVDIRQPLAPELVRGLRAV